MQQWRRYAARSGAQLVSMLLLAACGDACAAQWTIDVGGAQLAYAPAQLTIAAGDSVSFINRGGFHNVVADDGSFRCAQGCDASGGNGDPSSAAWSATVTFPSPGTVGYHCEVHGIPGAGMFGSIIVAAPPPPPPPRTVDAVPSGGWLLRLALAAVLVGGGAVLLRR